VDSLDVNITVIYVCQLFLLFRVLLYKLNINTWLGQDWVSLSQVTLNYLNGFLKPLLKIGSPDSEGYVKLTSKYIIWDGEGGVSQFFLRLQSYSYEKVPNLKIVAYLLLGCTDSGGYVKFTPKYILVGGEVGVSEFFQSYSFGKSGPHATFQNRSLLDSG
jgi:hypothetical protein